MTHTSTTAASLTIILALSSGIKSPPPSTSLPAPVIEAPAPTPVEAEPVGTRIHSENPSSGAFTEWALGRYTQAGLDLPDLDIYFHPTSEGCRGYKGLYSSGDTTARLDLCTTGRTPIAERLILHELGHAWSHHNLTDTQRQAFVALRGVPAWTGTTIDWEDRGSEQAAEILAWGLQETSRRPRSISDNDLDNLTTAFQQLTGTNPITDTGSEWQPGQPIPDRSE